MATAFGRIGMRRGTNPDDDDRASVRSISLNSRLGAVAIASAVVPMTIFRWIDFPLSDRLSGVDFACFGNSLAHPGFTPWSFGALAIVLVALVAAACLIGNRRAQCAGAAALMIVSIWAYLRFALGDANLLLAALRESDWWLIIIGQPPPNAIVEPTVWRQFYLDTIPGRLFSASHFLGLGWYAGLIAGLCAFFPAIRALHAHKARGVIGAAVASTLLLASIYLYRPLMAQWFFRAAVRSQVNGDANAAITSYSKAAALDDWVALNPKTYARIGEAYASLGRTDTSEYQLSEAENIVARNQGKMFIGDLPSAVDTYESLAREDGPLAMVAAMRENDVRLVYGLHLFQNGAFGAAVAQWETVLKAEPANWAAAYYLGLGYPTVNRFDDLRRVSERFARECRDPLAIGIFYNRLGDAHTKMGDYSSAHQAYYDSYRLDYTRNRYGISGLVGP